MSEKLKDALLDLIMLIVKADRKFTDKEKNAVTHYLLATYKLNFEEALKLSEMRRKKVENPEELIKKAVSVLKKELSPEAQRDTLKALILYAAVDLNVSPDEAALLYKISEELGLNLEEAVEEAKHDVERFSAGKVEVS